MTVLEDETKVRKSVRDFLTILSEQPENFEVSPSIHKSLEIKDNKKGLSGSVYYQPDYSFGLGCFSFLHAMELKQVYQSAQKLLKVKLNEKDEEARKMFENAYSSPSEEL